MPPKAKSARSIKLPARINKLPARINTNEPPLSLKKATEAIFIRPVAGNKLTLMKRKAFNILLKNAQDQGDQLTYHISLRDISSDMKFDSHNTEVFKNTLRGLAATQVEWDVLNEDGRKKWGVANLLAEAEIIDGELEYSFAPKIKKRLLDPAMYYAMDLRLQALFRSLYALTLYEICGRFLNNPGGVTMRKTWAEWRSVLCGDDSDGYAEFKFFNRDVIKRSVAEVNAVSDIHVEPVYFKRGRIVSEIQFKVRPASQQKLPLDGGDMFKSPVYKKMLELGLSLAEARDIFSEHDEAYLEANIKLTEERARKEGAPLTSKAAYFKAAVKGRYVKGVNAKRDTPALGSKTKAESKSKADSRDKLLRVFNERRIGEARAMYAEADDIRQDEWIEAFEREVVENNAPFANEYKRRGMGSKMVEASFMGWLASHTWGIPSDADLLEFALEAGLLGSEANA
mgnify:CR=1 FL=1